jgi:hypothetical protein
MGTKRTRDFIELMTEGMHLVREKLNESVRISHAKAFGPLKGRLIVADNLAPELAQSLFAQPGTYPVLVKLTTAPGEITNDSKINTAAAIAKREARCRPPLVGNGGHLRMTEMAASGSGNAGAGDGQLGAGHATPESALIQSLGRVRRCFAGNGGSKGASE